MANSSNKMLYIILGVVAFLIVTPIVLLVLMMLAGFLFYQSGAR